MLTHVEFRSDAFPSYDPVGEVNPGRYGKRLAEFLAQGLKEKGFDPLEPRAEDWGWIVPIRIKEFNLWIGCGNYDEYPEDGFLCFIEPHQSTIRRFFRKIDTTAKVNALQIAIDQILTDNPAIRDMKWRTHDEFNRVGQQKNSR